MWHANSSFVLQNERTGNKLMAITGERKLWNEVDFYILA